MLFGVASYLKSIVDIIYGCIQLALVCPLHLQYAFVNKYDVLIYLMMLPIDQSLSCCISSEVLMGHFEICIWALSQKDKVGNCKF